MTNTDNTTNDVTTPTISPEALALLGGGRIAYVKACLLYTSDAADE